MAPGTVDLPPPDPAVPALRILLGPEAREVVSPALAEAGLGVESVVARQVRYVPSRSVTVHFRVELTPAPDSLGAITVVATSGIEVPEHVPKVASDDIEIALWRYPFDPLLPGLALASDAEKVRRLLVELGGSDEPCRVRLRAYRAMRRAVVEVDGGAHRLFLKIVRPSRARAVHDRHLALAGVLPVPRSFGWSESQGIVALQAMPGVTLRASLAAGGDEVPSPGAIVELLDRFDEARAPTREVQGPHEVVEQHARLIGTVAPELGDRLRALVAAVGRLEREPEATVHGDFHASQVLVDGAAVVGLVDVDTAGRGERSNDFASMLAQLSTLAQANGGGAFDRYGARLVSRFDRRADPVALRLKTAAAVVGLATGPFRVQERDWRRNTSARLDLAERWLDSASPRRTGV